MSYYKLIEGRISRHVFAHPESPFTLYNVHLEDEEHTPQGRADILRLLAEDIESQVDAVVIAGDVIFEEASCSLSCRKVLSKTRMQLLPGFTRLSLSPIICWFVLLPAPLS